MCSQKNKIFGRKLHFNFSRWTHFNQAIWPWKKCSGNVDWNSIWINETHATVHWAEYFFHQPALKAHESTHKRHFTNVCVKLWVITYEVCVICTKLDFPYTNVMCQWVSYWSNFFDHYGLSSWQVTPKTSTESRKPYTSVDMEDE